MTITELITALRRDVDVTGDDAAIVEEAAMLIEKQATEIKHLMNLVHDAYQELTGGRNP